jgi:outer membrane protein OmpA-like peptidoglycan-associated protein
VSLFLASASFADGTGKAKAKAESDAAKDSATSTAAAEAPSQPAPAAQPAPPAPPARKNSDAYGWPQVDIFGGYSYVHFAFTGNIGASGGGGGPVNVGTTAGDPPFSNSRNLPGGASGSLAINLNKWFGIVADIGGYHGGSTSTENSGTIVSYLFGPRVYFRNSTRVTPFAQVLFGGAHLNVGSPPAAQTPPIPSFTSNAFAFAAGGGLDVKVAKHVSLRLAQVEYFLTNFTPTSVFPAGSSFNHQNNLRFSSGVLFSFGEKQPSAYRPPVASCSASPSSVMAESGQTVTVRANASSPDNAALTYSWTANGGKVDGTGPEARWDSTGTAPGTYTATARVSDSHGLSATCSADITVTPKPAPPPPSMTCSADPSTVVAGVSSRVTTRVNDQTNTPLNYTWRTNGGKLVGSGSTVQFDSTDTPAGTYTVTARVQNGVGGAADCAALVTVNAPAVPPQATKIGDCTFKSGSARVDNVCKRTLDALALRLQSDPKSRTVVVGYADPKEAKAQKLASERAAGVKKYLTKDKGVADARIETRGTEGEKGAGKANDRCELILVPEGASY